MKIDWKSKNTKITVIILAVIILPIIFNQTKSLITGAITAYMMSQPQSVEVSRPTSKAIYPEIETTGRIQAKYSVNIIARVDGWLQESHFKEGDTVKKGQKLFSIEPDEYIFAANNAQATVNENRAVFKNSEMELKRAKELLKEDFVSQEYYDNALTTRNKHRAALDGSIAQLNKAKLNLSYTNITAPIDGRISNILISAGNYVTASAGNLATIYTTNPMKVTFTIKSKDFIQLKRFIINNEEKTNKQLVKVALRLSDNSIYEQLGNIEYADNKIDETTGSITFRAVFDNPHEILVHGDYVGVILKVQEAQNVMLIPQSATKTDVGTGYYVWVVEDGKAVKRDVVVNKNIDNNWVVEDGLDFNDIIITKGIQNVYKTGQPVNVTNSEEIKPKEQVKKEVKKECKFKNFIKKVINKVKSIFS